MWILVKVESEQITSPPYNLPRSLPSDVKLAKHFIIEANKIVKSFYPNAELCSVDDLPKSMLKESGEKPDSFFHIDNQKSNSSESTSYKYYPDGCSIQ